MIELQIKNAENSDIQGIMEVEIDAFDTSIQEKNSTFENRLRSYNSGFFVIKDVGKNKIAGYFCSEIWSFIPTERIFFELNHNCDQNHDNYGSVLYISSFALKKEYQGNKIGSIFFFECIKKILNDNQNLQEVVLLVNEFWIKAINIYEKAGFKRYSILPDFFYQTNESCYSDGLLYRVSRKDILGVLNDR